MSGGGQVVLVATTGGHLTQLFDLAPRLPLRGPRLWVTFDGEQARTLLAGERVVFVPDVAERDVAGVARAVGHARRILGGIHNGGTPASAVVSTGSGVALAFLPLAALRGIPAHYIESAARTGSPSLTGRLLRLVPGVRLYRQYPHTARGRWRYGGSVFDGFAAVLLPPRLLRRVVVTLGTMDQGFRRLLERLVAILPPATEVLWQTGATPTEGLGIRGHRLLPAPVIAAAMREADVVVAHAGCGSALTALKAGRCPVLVPRDPRGGEVVDAHQTEIAEWLDAKGLALARQADRLTLDDLHRAVRLGVERAAEVPDFRLAGVA